MLSSLLHLHSWCCAEVLGGLFADEMMKFHQTKQTTPLYSALLDIFTVPEKLKKLGREEPIPRNDVMCVLCNSVFGPYIEEIRAGTSKEEMTELVMELCVALNLQSERVCRGLINLNIEELMYIVLQRPSLQADQLCAIVFQNLECPAENMETFEWTVNVDPNKPALSGSKDTSVAPSSSDLTVVHITDPHYDPNYQVGSFAACEEPVCCRFDQSIPAGSDPSVAAGRWGDYRYCDSPLDAVIDAFTQIRRQHSNIDYVYFTGDIVDHAVWNTAISTNKQSITRVNNLVANAFSGVPVFPVLGNHESHPVNLFSPGSVPDQFNTKWLYDYIATEWSKWLPADALETVRLGGYYTVLVRSGFRIITINNNDCYTYNWWIAYEPAFPRTQLQWLHDTLLAAEAAGEKVHILGHVPPGEGSCFKVYAREYRRIVERFWNTISAQFVGHTHADEFNIFYSRDNPTQALNVMWNGGSTTAFNDVNPNYRIMTMDTQTYQINRHETWIYNLTAANLSPNQNPTWFKEYDFAAEYGVENLSPRSLSYLAEEFALNPQKLHRVS